MHWVAVAITSSLLVALVLFVVYSMLSTGRKQHLRFIHIPKTAGTTLEDLAMQHGIRWGRNETKTLLCKLTRTNAPSCNPWHRPPRKTQTPTFAVIRDPYERCVSEYKYQNPNGTAQKLNQWVKSNLQNARKNPYMTDCHFLPQAQYVYDEKQRKVIPHLLRFSHLETDFNKLMEQYGLPMRLHAGTKRGRESAAKPTAADLNDESRKLIESFYVDDFQLIRHIQVAD